MNPIVTNIWAEPRRKSTAKKLVRNNGLVVRLGEAEEFHASGKEVVPKVRVSWYRYRKGLSNSL